MEESVSEGISSPAVDTHTPDAPACKKKRKDAVFHASLIGLMNLLTIAWKSEVSVSPSSRRRRRISSTENWHNQ